MIRYALLTVAILYSSLTSSEAGMIPFDSPVGEIGGRGHWYALRTMKGLDFWVDPPEFTDIRENEDGTYEIAGEPPIAVVVVLHPDFYRDREPWRRAIDWIRQAEQIFRNSGVPLRFVINHIETWQQMPDTKRAALEAMDADQYSKFEPDLLIMLLPSYFGADPLCGVAQLGSPAYYGGILKSASGCDPETLAHELGHNFGLRHDFDSNSDLSLFDDNGEQLTRRGYCVKGESGSHETCNRGTIMAYATYRYPFFSNRLYTVDGGEPLGDETHDAVEYLNRVKTGRSLAWELDQKRPPPYNPDAFPRIPPEIEVILD
jgi:hypothetical protein